MRCHVATCHNKALCTVPVGNVLYLTCFPCVQRAERTFGKANLPTPTPLPRKK